MWQTLRKNHSEALPRHIVFFDCETLPKPDPNDDASELHSLRFGVAQAGRWMDGRLRRHKELVFYKRWEFWKWLKRLCGKKHTVWLVAHNIGFDLTVAGLWPRIQKGGYKFSSPGRSRHPDSKRKYESKSSTGLLVLNDPPTIIGLEDNFGGRLVCIDTLNYWRTSLKALGKSVGLDKLDMPEFDEGDDVWVPYCRRDVEIIKLAFCQLINWIESNKLGQFRFTGPGQAMGAFRHAFMEHKILLHDRNDVKAMERGSYYGGQTEAYRLGEVNERVSQYDVNSLYPYVMRNNLFPAKLITWETDRPLGTRQPDIYPERAVCEVELETDGETFPLRIDDAPCYVQGKFVTWLCGPELRRAYDCGYVRRWGRWAMYDLQPLFTDYVDYFWARRKEYKEAGQKVQETFCKLLLNSLYGKFGQRAPSWEYVPDKFPAGEWLIEYVYDNLRKEYVKWHYVGPYSFRWDPGGEHPKSFPAVAAFTTAYAREHMKGLRTCCGASNVFYQATDSIAVNDLGRTRLEAAGVLCQHSLGGLKLECVGDTAEFFGLNHYRIGTKLVEGGKKASSVDLGDGYWQETQFQSLNAVLSTGGGHRVRVTQRIKHRTGDYTKGHEMADGSVEAFRLDGELILNK